MKDENFEIDLDAIKASIKALKRESISVSDIFFTKMISELMKTSDEHDSFLEGSAINGVEIRGLGKIFSDANLQYNRLLSKAERTYNTYKSADTGGAPVNYSGGGAVTVATASGSIFPSASNSSSSNDIKAGLTMNEIRIHKEKEIAEQKEKERKAQEEEKRLQEEARKAREAEEEQRLREEEERIKAEEDEKRKAEEAKQQEQNNTGENSSSEPSKETSSTQTPSTDNNNSNNTDSNNNSGNTSKPSTPVNPNGTSSLGSENYHTGGGYSSNSGYTSSTEVASDGVTGTTDTTTSTDTPIEVLDDAPTSIDDIIKDNYTKIPSTEEPIETPTSKGKGTIIPIIAGLSAAAAAGIGAKAYLDRKENKEDEESDEIDIEDYSNDDTLNLEADDNIVPVAYLDDDDEDDEEKEYQEAEPEKYDARTNEELADLN